MATLYNHASNLENANGSSGTFVHQPGGRTRQRLIEGGEFSTMAAQPTILAANVTALAGTAPTVQFIYETSWDGGQNWNAIYTSPVISATGVQPTLVIGAADRLLGSIGRLRWVIGGTAGPSATFTASVTTVN